MSAHIIVDTTEQRERTSVSLSLLVKRDLAAAFKRKIIEKRVTITSVVTRLFELYLTDPVVQALVDNPPKGDQP